MTLPHPHDDPSVYDHVLGKRFVAWVIDIALTLLVVVLVIAGTLGIGIFIAPLIWSAVAIAYRYVTLTRWAATPGMFVMALQLRKLDGSFPDKDLVLKHSLIYAATMVFVVPQIGSVAMMLTTPHKQGLNDWLLGTAVVNKLMRR